MKSGDMKELLKALSLKELRDLEEAVVAEMKIKSEKSKKIRKLMIYTDGASRGNPGHAGIGLLIFDENDEKILQDCQYIGTTTNNEAEYRALLLALDRAADITQGPIECYSDSELMIRQLTGRYAIKSEKLLTFFQEIKERIKIFSSVSFTHLSREHPKLRLADQMANRGIDEARTK